MKSEWHAAKIVSPDIPQYRQSKIPLSVIVVICCYLLLLFVLLSSSSSSSFTFFISRDWGKRSHAKLLRDCLWRSYFAVELFDIGKPRANLIWKYKRAPEPVRDSKTGLIGVTPQRQLNKQPCCHETENFAISPQNRSIITKTRLRGLA